MSSELKNAYKSLHSKVLNVLDNSAYNFVDFNKMFSKRNLKKNSTSLLNSFLGLQID